MSQYTSPHLVASHGEEKPYHKYLLKPEQRPRPQQLWSMYCGHVLQFETIDDALAHGAAVLGDDRFDVVPVLDMSLPTDVREDNPRARLIGTEIVKEH